MNGTSSQDDSRANEVAGRPFRLVDNGAWCWYQDDRIVLDPKTGRFFIGSIANQHGPGGETRDGDIEVTAFDPATGTARVHTLHKALTSYGAGDDHNVPALWMRPDGGCLAMYTGHNNDTQSFHRIVYDDRLSDEQTFDWNHRPGGCDFPATYSTEKQAAGVGSRSPGTRPSATFGQLWHATMIPADGYSGGGAPASRRRISIRRLSPCVPATIDGRPDTAAPAPWEPVALDSGAGRVSLPKIIGMIPG